MTPEEAKQKHLVNLIAAIERSLKGGEIVPVRKPDTALERYISYPDDFVGKYTIKELLNERPT